jgi:hypothetical protein
MLVNRQESEGDKDEGDFPSSMLDPLFEFLTEMEALA